MRRIIVVTAVVSAWLVAAVAPSSAQVVATIVLTPNPLQAGESVTITNSPDATSVCLASPKREAGALPEGGDDVSVLLIQVPGTQEIVTGASVDPQGNWQVVVPVPEAGQYNVAAVCNLNAVTYQETTLSVTAGAEPPPTEPPPAAPPAAPAEPQAQAPAFTG